LSSGKNLIIEYKEFIEPVNQWYADFANAWGEQNNIQVALDSESQGTNVHQTQAEFAAEQGHDLYLLISSPAVYEVQLIDHHEIYQECERRYGKALDVAIKSCWNPKTDRFFGVLDGYSPMPVIYRKDLWESVGRAPTTGMTSVWVDAISS
jgi:multiple sugar transport system substrate-binding protein